MKKIQQMLLGLVALMATSSVFAIELGSGPNDVTLLDCSQLANDISIVLSGGVVGGIDCTTDTVVVGVSVCHTTGLTTDRTESETPTDVGGTPTCPTGMSLNDDSTACIGTVTGAGFPSATTAQGTVTSRFPGNTCSAANADTEATAAVNDAL